jgi:hypothetical protein
MKVRLEIRNKKYDEYLVNVYEVKDTHKVMIGHYRGSIDQIHKNLEDNFDCDVEIEKSGFQGWY